MDNNKVLRLGYSALTNWEILMIKEGLIDAYDKDFDSDIEYDKLKKLRINNRKFLLFAIVLFDKIDATYLSMLNMEKLIDLGIVDEYAYMVEPRLDRMSEIPLALQHLSVNLYKKDKQLKVAKEISEEIMLVCKKQIIRALIKNNEMHGFDLEQINELYENYEDWLLDCEFWASSNTMKREKQSLGIIKESIMFGLYDSDKTNSIYYDGTISPNKCASYKIDGVSGDDVSCIMNVDLSSELYHLPIPTTMDEALMLRNRPEIVSFRKVFFEWCQAISSGNIDMVTQIKKDVDLAQKGLKKYYKWEESKVKLFNCIIDVLIGQIPYLSTISGTLSPFQTRNILRKRQENSWVLLLK